MQFHVIIRLPVSPDWLRMCTYSRIALVRMSVTSSPVLSKKVRMFFRLILRLSRISLRSEAACAWYGLPDPVGSLLITRAPGPNVNSLRYRMRKRPADVGFGYWSTVAISVPVAIAPFGCLSRTIQTFTTVCGACWSGMSSAGAGNAGRMKTLNSRNFITFCCPILFPGPAPCSTAFKHRMYAVPSVSVSSSLPLTMNLSSALPPPFTRPPSRIGRLGPAKGRGMLYSARWKLGRHCGRRISCAARRLHGRYPRIRRLYKSIVPLAAPAQR